MNRTSRPARRAQPRHVIAWAVGMVVAGIWLPAQSQVIPNGTTATQVQAGAAGGTVVTPARPINDVSYNAFRQFDVQAAGLIVRNGETRARTIVAEVFSQAPSRINGPVSIDGPRANFILANQNGITIDGGRFTNFGSLALTTGAVTLRDMQLSPSQTQRYVDLTTRTGRIEIGSGGLEAAVIRLELVAKSVGLDGPVTNSFSSPTARTRLVVGDSTARFDTLASPTDNLTPWMQFEAGSASASGAALVVSAASKVSSGRIDVVVTDKGAGVNNAGDFGATHGDLVLTTSGQLVQDGGALRAAGAVNVQAASVRQSAQAGRSSEMSAGTLVDVRASGDITSTDSSFSGRTADPTGKAPTVLLQAGGDIRMETTAGSPKPALAFAAEGDLVLRAGRDIRSVNSRVISNGKLTLEAGGAAHLETAIEPGAGRLEANSSDLVSRRSRWSIEHGAMVDSGQESYWVAADDLTVRAASVANRGGRIFSNNGRVVIQAVGEVFNEARLVGAARFDRSCFLFVCRTHVSSDEKAIGGEISAAKDVSIMAGWRVINQGGAVLGVQGVRVEAPVLVASAIQLHQPLERDEGLKALLGHRWGRLYRYDQGGSFTAQTGRIEVTGEAVQDGGYFAGEGATQLNLRVIRKPEREPVRLDDHLGIFRW